MNNLTTTPLVETEILVVEDGDAKFSSIKKIIDEHNIKNLRIDRAATLTAAEKKLLEKDWSLIILDISLDITSSSAGPRKGGHATLGGMDIASKMFLLGLDFKTVIVTAFDAFQSTPRVASAPVILGLEDIERRAKEIMGSSFVGCVRYGGPTWKEDFRRYLNEALCL